MPVDITRYTFNSKFTVTGTYTPKGGSAIADVEAILSKGSNPGRESGKGLTVNVRAVEANWTRILLKQSIVTTEPPIFSTFVTGSDTWEIVTAEDTGAGAWRCEAKKQERSRGRGRR